MKTYVSFISYSQININCEKYYVTASLIFSQFTPIYKVKNFENAPAQVFTYLYVHVYFYDYMSVKMRI